MTKYPLKLALFLVIIVLAFIWGASAFAGDSEEKPYVPTVVNGYVVPKEIGGLPVIFVHTLDNTRGMQLGEVRLVVQDSANTLDESLAKTKVPEYLNNHPLPEGWSLLGIGGPNTSVAEYAKHNEEANEFYDRYGPIYLGPTSLPRDETGKPIYPSLSSTPDHQNYTQPFSPAYRRDHPDIAARLAFNIPRYSDILPLGEFDKVMWNRQIWLRDLLRRRCI